MPDLLVAGERYRKKAVEFFELSRTADTPFIRDYYESLAKRYLLHAENQEKLAAPSEGLGAGQHSQIAESPSVQPSSEAVSPEEASAAPASATPLPSGQAAGAHRRRRRRSPTP